MNKRMNHCMKPGSLWSSSAMCSLVSERYVLFHHHHLVKSAFSILQGVADLNDTPSLPPSTSFFLDHPHLFIQHIYMLTVIIIILWCRNTWHTCCCTSCMLQEGRTLWFFYGFLEDLMIIIYSLKFAGILNDSKGNVTCTVHCTCRSKQKKTFVIQLFPIVKVLKGV